MTSHQSKSHHVHEAKYKAQFERTRRNKIASIKRELRKNPNHTLAKNRLAELENKKY